MNLKSCARSSLRAKKPYLRFALLPVNVFHVEEYDGVHSDGEDRYITTASYPQDRRLVLIVSWTDRSTEDSKITRIISARLATPTERKKYAKEIGGQ